MKNLAKRQICTQRAAAPVSCFICTGVIQFGLLTKGDEMAEYPDKEHTLSLLGDWAKHHTAVETLMDGIEASVGLDLNGPMFGTVWGLFDAYTATLATEIGDLSNWLDWYHYETNMGKRSKQVIVSKKTMQVKTLAQLAELIVSQRGLI